MHLFPILLSTVLLVTVDSQLSAYTTWTPTVIRYCDTIGSSTTTTRGGVVCGSSSWYAMSAFYPDIAIKSEISLGLINVGWMTTAALTTEIGFWKTCKNYAVRIFDGLYENTGSACGLYVNPPTSLPSCNDTVGNLLYRSGSGYCMKEKVCGAKTTVDFLAAPGNTSVIYSWLPVQTAQLVALGYTKVGQCFGYTKAVNKNLDDTNLRVDEFY